MTLPILETHDLHFLDLLHYPDIAIEAGSTVFLQGPSGSGKSTLLRLFNATASPSRGSIFYQRQDIAALDTVPLRREVLLAGQSVFLFEGSIRENFTLFYGYRDLPPPDEAHMKACLGLCRAAFPLDADTGTMSGGERQRVYIAIFLSFSPAVLMLDEPTSALDAATANEMMAGLKSHCRAAGGTLVVISHDDALAAEYADRVVTLEGGNA